MNSILFLVLLLVVWFQSKVKEIKRFVVNLFKKYVQLMEDNESLLWDLLECNYSKSSYAAALYTF